MPPPRPMRTPWSSWPKETSAPLAVKAGSLDEAGRTDPRSSPPAGQRTLVLDSGARTPRKALERPGRHCAGRPGEDNPGPWGSPPSTFPCEMTGDPLKETPPGFHAGGQVRRASCSFRPERAQPLSPRLGGADEYLYRSPSAPWRPPRGSTRIGGPNENSPVLITSNFSLTYLTFVSGEVEGSRVPILASGPRHTEGLSVIDRVGRRENSAPI